MMGTAEMHGPLPLPAWEKIEDVSAMDPQRFRALHRKLYIHRQRIDHVKGSFDAGQTEREVAILQTRANNIRASRTRHYAEAARDLKCENARLVERLCAVVRESETRQRQLMSSTPREYPGAPAATSRRKFAQDVDRENKLMLDRLKSAGPVVASSRELASRYKAHRALVSRHSRFKRQCMGIDLSNPPPPPRMPPKTSLQPWRKTNLPPLSRNPRRAASAGSSPAPLCHSPTVCAIISAGEEDKTLPNSRPFATEESGLAVDDDIPPEASKDTISSADNAVGFSRSSDQVVSNTIESSSAEDHDRSSLETSLTLGNTTQVATTSVEEPSASTLNSDLQVLGLVEGSEAELAAETTELAQSKRFSPAGESPEVAESEPSRDVTENENAMQDLRREEDVRMARAAAAEKVASISAEVAERMSPRNAQAEAERRQIEEDARLKAAEEARLKAEEEARLQAEEDARQKIEEARLKMEEDARLKVAEEAKQKADEEARLKAAADAKKDEEARLARLKAEEDARLRAEEVARQKEAKRKAEEDARLKAEEEEAARQRAEEDARLEAEERAKLQAEEEARRLREARQRREDEEEVRRRAEAEASQTFSDNFETAGDSPRSSQTPASHEYNEEEENYSDDDGFEATDHGNGELPSAEFEDESATIGNSMAGSPKKRTKGQNISATSDEDYDEYEESNFEDQSDAENSEEDIPKAAKAKKVQPLNSKDSKDSFEPYEAEDFDDDGSAEESGEL